MKRANSDSLVAGFSLIEAMAALALTAIIILALSSVTGQWLPNWRRGFVDLQRADLLGVGLERVVDDLSAAEYVTPSAGARRHSSKATVRPWSSFDRLSVRTPILIWKSCVWRKSRRIAVSRWCARERASRRQRRAPRRRLSPSAILSPSFARPSTFRSPMQDQTVFGFRVGKVRSSCPRRCGYRSGTQSPTGCCRRRPWLALGSQPPAAPRMRPALFLRPGQPKQQ